MSTKNKDVPPLTEGPRLLSLQRGDVVVRQRDLVGAAKMHDAIVRRKMTHILPSNLGIDFVYSHLQGHIDYVIERSGAMRDQVMGTATAQSSEDTAREILDRVKNTVNGNYLQGDARRGVFFPVGPGPHTTAQRLRAIEAGITKHGLFGLPPDITAGSLGALAALLSGVEVSRDATDTTLETTAATVENMLPTTRSIRKRLGALLRGYYGRYSPELAAYGLKVPSKKRNKRLTKEEKALRDEKRAAKKLIKEAASTAKQQAKLARKEAKVAALEAELKALEEQAATARHVAASQPVSQSPAATDPQNPPASAGSNGAGDHKPTS